MGPVAGESGCFCSWDLPCFPALTYFYNCFLNPSSGQHLSDCHLLPQVPFCHCMSFLHALSPASAFPAAESCFSVSSLLFCTFSPAHIKLLQVCIIFGDLCAVCGIFHSSCWRHNPCDEPVDW